MSPPRVNVGPMPGHNRFLSAMPESEYALLAPHLHVVPLVLGSVLHDRDRPIEHAYFPHSGMVSIVVPMREGSEAEAAAFGRTGTVGANAALGSKFAAGRAVVQVAGTASRIGAERLRVAAEESAVIRNLALRSNDLLLAQVHQSVGCNAWHNIRQRFGRWLLQAHDCCERQTIPLTQEFLGHMLGVRRTSVSLAARELLEKGVIDYRRGHIQIIDRPALEKTACECYFTIQRLTDKLFPKTTAEI